MENGPRQPKAIRFEDDDYMEVSTSQGKYVNPFET